MIFIYLGITIILSIIIILLILFIKFLFKKIDEIEITDKKDNIKHQADLADDINKFEETFTEEITKSNSEKIEGFINK